jgi:predicted 2-oxoglutarate/Fe(II)-dependent dioxygenase YbiX
MLTLSGGRRWRALVWSVAGGRAVRLQPLAGALHTAAPAVHTAAPPPAPLLPTLPASVRDTLALLWSSPFPATLQDASFRLLDVNDAFLAFSGFRRDALVGNDPVDLQPAEDRDGSVALRMDLMATAAQGGSPSGFMREVDGKTVGVFDPAMKRRSDCTIEDEGLRSAARARILRRIVPELKRVHHFEATRMERYIVACYDSADEGHFGPHRDNTTSGTAHRRFAVTINLNAEEFEGGELRFPEYGKRSWRAPTGGAVVFSCSLLHQALPVTGGVRYAFLPFLYDDAAARIREANNEKLGEGVGAYRAGPTTAAAR